MVGRTSTGERQSISAHSYREAEVAARPRTKRLLIVDSAALHVRQDGRLVEVLTELGGLLASQEHFRAFGFGILDVRVRLVDRLRVDQRAVRHAFVEPVSDLEFLDLLC